MKHICGDQKLIQGINRSKDETIENTEIYFNGFALSSSVFAQTPY